MLVAGKSTLLRTLAGKYQKDASLKVCDVLLATCTRITVAPAVQAQFSVSWNVMRR